MVRAYSIRRGHRVAWISLGTGGPQTRVQISVAPLVIPPINFEITTLTKANKQRAQYIVV